MHQRRNNPNQSEDPEPEVYWIHVVPRKRTGETITLLITLAALFLLLVLLLGHPVPPPTHQRFVVPAHSSEKR